MCFKLNFISFLMIDFKLNVTMFYFIFFLFYFLVFASFMPLFFICLLSVFKIKKYENFKLNGIVWLFNLEQLKAKNYMKKKKLKFSHDKFIVFCMHIFFLFIY